MLPALQSLLDDHAERHPRGRQRRPAAARHRRHADSAVSARPGEGAAARVVGDAGVRADGLERPRHRGDQPGHRAAAHRGAPRRPSDRAVAATGPRPKALARPAQRPRPRRFRDSACSNSSAARAERRRDGTAREWADDAPADVDDLNVIAVRYLPDERVSPSARRRVQSTTGRSPNTAIRAVTLAALAPRPGERLWDVGAGSGSIAIEWCRSWRGCTRGRVRARRAAPPQHRRSTPRPSASASTCAATRRTRSTAPSTVGDLHRRRPDPARSARRMPRQACPPADAWSPTPSPRSPKPLLAQAHSRFGGELQRFQHYQGEPLGGFTGWRPQMPDHPVVGDQA